MNDCTLCGNQRAVLEKIPAVDGIYKFKYVARVCSCMKFLMSSQRLALTLMRARLADYASALGPAGGWCAATLADVETILNDTPEAPSDRRNEPIITSIALDDQLPPKATYGTDAPPDYY